MDGGRAGGLFAGGGVRRFLTAGGVVYVVTQAFLFFNKLFTIHKQENHTAAANTTSCDVDATAAAGANITALWRRYKATLTANARQ